MIDLGPLVEALKRDEGFRARPYQDTEGKWTIGYGTLIENLSEDEAEWLLRHRLTKTADEVYRRWPWLRSLSGARQAAVLNMAYNLGAPRLAGFVNMLGALQRGDYEQAAAEALDSKWARQVGPRAHRIAKQIKEG